MTSKRPTSLAMRGATCQLPVFFPSISSVKTNLSPAEYLRVLLLAGYPTFLISAYDVHHASPGDRKVIEDGLNAAASANSIILLDSGNYESYWLRDSNWTAEQFHAIARGTPAHAGFCYDNQFPPAKVADAIDDVERAVLRDQAAAPRASIIPIVHAPVEILPAVASEVARRLRPLMLAVPERHLGEGVLMRATTVMAVRAALRTLDYYCPLHLLGTGNPRSLLLYAWSGADSFDGLEWCQTAIDHATAMPVHFQQWDFYRQQTPLGDADDLPYAQRVLVHNLVFYQQWLGKMADAASADCLDELAWQSLPGDFLVRAEAARKEKL